MLQSVIAYLEGTKMTFQKGIPPSHITRNKGISCRETISLAINSFRLNKARFIMTSVGMVIGSLSLILVVTITQTGSRYIMQQIQAIAPNMVEVEYANVNTGDTNEGTTSSDPLTLADEAVVLQEVPNIAYSSSISELRVPLSSHDGSTVDTLVLGVEPHYKDVRNLVILSGRFMDDIDEAGRAKAAVVTEKLALQRFGSADAALSQDLYIDGLPFTIIGVFKEKVDDLGQTELAAQTVLLPFSVATYLLGTDDAKQLYFSIRQRDQVEQTSNEILRVIRSRHRPLSVYNIQTLTNILNAADLISQALALLLFMVSAVTLAVGGVGILNIMLANVRARVREIGIRRALGATKGDIRLQFLLEAVMVSLGGGIVGVLLGVAIPYVLGTFTNINIPVSPLSVIVALLSSATVGVGFGTTPANRAAALDPIEALKYE